MIWASQLPVFFLLTVQSFSIFGYKEYNLILVLPIWWCPCVESSPVLLEEGVCYDQCVLLAKLLAFAASFCTQRLNLLVTPGISWFPTFAFWSPMMKRTSFLGISSRRSCRSSENPFNFCFFSITGHGIDLDYCDIELFALETNRDHSVIFEIAPKYCILDSFVGYDGYSISSKGFLPTVIDIMVIWVKLSHSGPF